VATKRGVVETLVKVVEGRASVVATHDLDLAAKADEIVLLVDGHVRARGTHDQLNSSSLEFRRLADRLAQVRT